MLAWRRTLGGSLVALLVATSDAGGASRRLDGLTQDWCHGVGSAKRIEDSAARLGCGSCDGAFYPVACLSDRDCAAGQPCSGSQEESVWFDRRTDGAVNDLRTVAIAQDEFALYLVIELYSWLYPSAMPNVQIALDFQPGGTHDLLDPLATLVAPGVCSDSSDRACTEDEDCHFCARSFEFPTCCDEGNCAGDELCRVRICGEGCHPFDPLDYCDTSQSCENLGTSSVARVGLASDPAAQADYLVTFSLTRLLLAIPAAQLSRWTGDWSPLGTFEVVNQVIGVPERPPSFAFEVAIPWEAFGCANWTAAIGCGADATATGCGCPDFGPGAPISFTSVVSREGFAVDFAPRGAAEDVASEPLAGATTLTANGCPGGGIATTLCEIADGSADAFAPELILEPGGTASGLKMDRDTTGAESRITLRWNPSCSFGDTDYEVYRGNLQALPGYDHRPRLCSTAGATTAGFVTGDGDGYFLVVPTDGTVEGSYGVAFPHAERPAAAASCRGGVAASACP